MPHDKLKTLEEISDELHLSVDQLQRLFYRHRESFTANHTAKLRSPLPPVRGNGMMRLFSELGVRRLEYLGRNIKKTQEVSAVPVTIGTQKYQLIEKISHPKTVEPLAATHDDEVLDIAVKIIAERTAFNKIKEEITMLREKNARMKSMMLRISAALSDGGDL